MRFIHSRSSSMWSAQYSWYAQHLENILARGLSPTEGMTFCRVSEGRVEDKTNRQLLRGSVGSTMRWPVWLVKPWVVMREAIWVASVMVRLMCWRRERRNEETKGTGWQIWTWTREGGKSWSAISEWWFLRMASNMSWFLAMGLKMIGRGCWKGKRELEWRGIEIDWKIKPSNWNGGGWELLSCNLWRFWNNFQRNRPPELYPNPKIGRLVGDLVDLWIWDKISMTTGRSSRPQQPEFRSKTRNSNHKKLLWESRFYNFNFFS